MKISIFGLGYVGTVTLAVLSQKNKVIGVDVSPLKAEMINEGKSPIIEKAIGDLIKEGRKNKNIEATTDHKYALLNSDISIICVGTPSNEDGGHDLSILHEVMGQITDVLKEKNQYHLIVIRSTIPPGTTETIIAQYFKDMNVGICFNPEFLREGTAVEDYINPPFIIAACSDDKSKKLMEELYKGINSDFIIVPFKEAEVVKMLCNVFHALKVVFGNEVGRFCSAYGIDGKNVMKVLCKDKKLNISEKYLIPGFAYGGSCLPKDLRSFLYISKTKYLDLPVVSSIEESNEKHIQKAIKDIESFKTKNVGFVGLSFKKGTDDLRESPYVKLAEYFIGKGYKIKIFDEEVSLARLFGANKAYIEKEIPHISSLLVDSLEELHDCELIIVNRNVDYSFNGKHIVNLT